MKFFSEIKEVLLEKINGIPSNVSEARFWYNEATKRFSYRDNTANRALLAEDLQQTVTNKAFTTGVTIVNPDSIQAHSDLKANIDTNIGLGAYDPSDLLYATDTEEYFGVKGTGGSQELIPFEGGGSGGGGGTSIARNQVGHGFVECEAIYHNGSTWQKARANNADTLAEYVVTQKVDDDNFVAFKFGEATIAGHGFTTGEHYFLSADIAGGAQDTPADEFNAPVFYVEDANTIHVQVHRATSDGGQVIVIPEAFGIVVGNGADVANGDAHYDDFQEAMDAASAGDRITLLNRTFTTLTPPFSVVKELHIFGSGARSVIDSAIQFSNGSQKSSTEKLKYGQNVTVDNGVTKLILTNGWIANTATLTDNNPTADDSLYQLVED